jgi:diguanylate cyclase
MTAQVVALEANVASLRAELAAMKVNARDATSRQMEFLATVAHELRNPLMPLRLAALMLDRARTDDDAHAKLQDTIKGQVAQMTRLIGDLLDGSRLSTGKFRLERTLVDLGAVLKRVVETCQPGIDERQQHFNCKLPEAPVMLLGDSARLVQLFSNLLENASKYTPCSGEITLATSVRNKAVVVTITDNGVGIPAKTLPHVFDMFVRDQHAALNHGGLGIGLAVVRELIKAHEGQVFAKSAGPGTGSEFTVSLPLPVALAPRPTSAA